MGFKGKNLVTLLVIISQLSATNTDYEDILELFDDETARELRQLCSENLNERPDSSFERLSTPNTPEVFENDLDVLFREYPDDETNRNPLYNKILTDLKNVRTTTCLIENELPLGHNIEGNPLSWQQLESSLSAMESYEISRSGLTNSSQNRVDAIVYEDHISDSNASSISKAPFSLSTLFDSNGFQRDAYVDDMIDRPMEVNRATDTASNSMAPNTTLQNLMPIGLGIFDGSQSHPALRMVPLTPLAGLYNDNGGLNEAFFERTHQPSPIMHDFVDFTAPRMKYLKRMEVINGKAKLSVRDYTTFLEKLMPYIDMKVENGCFSWWDAWVCLNELFILRWEEQKDGLVNNKPYLTMFTLSVLAGSWSNENIALLSDCVKERARDNPSPPASVLIDTITQDGNLGERPLSIDKHTGNIADTGSNNGAQQRPGDEALESARAYFKSDPATVRTIKKTILHLNTLFTSEHFRTIIMNQLELNIRNPIEKRMFEIWFDAFTSGDYVYPFFAILDKLESLRGYNCPIHNKYLDQVGELLNRIQTDIVESMNGTISRQNPKVVEYSDPIERSLSKFRSKLGSGQLTYSTTIGSELNIILMSWTQEINDAGLANGAHVSYYINTALPAMCKAIDVILMLLMTIGKNNRATALCYSRFKTLFDDIIFAEFEPERVRMFFDAALGHHILKTNGKNGLKRATEAGSSDSKRKRKAK